MNTITKETGLGPNPAVDAQELARLARLCLGSTSTILFSKRTGLSRSFLSAVLNANLRSTPSKKSLEKMASPDAQPQNGITAAQLLKAAGYQPDGPAAAAPAAPVKVDGSTFLNEVQQYCAADIEQMRTAAQCMVGELIRRSIQPRFTISMETGWISITEEDREAPRLHICMPAFILDEHLAAYAAAAAVLRLGEARRAYKDREASFYILTNNEALGAYLCQAFSTATDMEILLTKDFYSVVPLHPPCGDAKNDK